MKVSVAMITYNHERFIGQALESVFAQRVNFDYEVVIGEDCSTDRTRDVITELQERHPGQIRLLLRSRNVGVNRNFAETIAACTGVYVAFLEGDDFWTVVDKLQKQVDFLDTHPDRSICCHRVKFVYDGSMGSEDFTHDVFPTQSAGSYTITDLLKGNFIMTCSMVLRRGLIGPFPSWFRELKVGDWPLCAMVARFGSIELFDEVMAGYRVHPGSTWYSLPKTSRLRETARMLRAVDRELGYRYTQTITQTIATPYLSLALQSRSNGKRTETAKHLMGWLCNGGLRMPVSPRLPVGLAAYVLIGSAYKLFSRASSEVRD